MSFDYSARLNCSWRSALRMVAETTGGSQRRLKLAGSLSGACAHRKRSARGLRLGFNSIEIQRLYEADDDYPLRLPE
jgi:hypothetical protein